MNPLPSVCLVMIVRNEEKVIQRCLESVKPYISFWAISDTGSTDQTCAIIHKTLNGIPGELSHDDWRDFSYNRNLCLERTKHKAKYLLLIDADMVLNSREDFRVELREDAYLVPFTGDLDYSIIRLVSTRLNWRYRGSVHEVIESDPPTIALPLEGVTITHFEDGSARSDKWEREIRVLSQELAEQPDNPRTVFYLAQSYRENRQYDKAAELYERRAGMGGWAEEMWYALYQLGMMQEQIVADRRVSIFTLLQAYQVRPTRLEPILPIVQFYNAHKQFALGYLFAMLWTETPYPNDILFVERPVYEYLLPYEYAIACFHTSRIDEAKRVTEILERTGKIPSDMLNTLKTLVVGP